MNWRTRAQGLLLWVVLIVPCREVLLLADGQVYRFGSEDTFVLRGADIEELAEKPFRVDPSGTVTFPMVGSIQVAGLTVGELEGQINARLKRFVNNPAVSVSVTEVRSRPISVYGAVNASGVYQAQGAKSLIEALSLAGGLRNDAGSTLTVTRQVESGPLPLQDAVLDPTQKFWVAKVDVEKLMSAERPEDNIRLQANDVISVQKANLVYVIGDVNKAGAIPLTGRMTVTEALARSEGLQKSASRKNIRILRQMAGSDQRSEIPIDFQKVLSGRAADQELRANDIIVIPTNVSRSAALRTLEAALQIGTGLIIWHP